MSVDLPEPFLPVIAIESLKEKSKLTFLNIAFLLKFLVRFFAWREIFSGGCCIK
jgi:hypothetical protein